MGQTRLTGISVQDLQDARKEMELRQCGAPFVHGVVGIALL
jgi:hypothetical protein